MAAVGALGGYFLLSLLSLLPVVKDFDVTVPGGTVVALVGRSGAGKTTVLKALYDVLLTKLSKRGLPLKNFEPQKAESALGGTGTSEKSP